MFDWAIKKKIYRGAAGKIFASCENLVYVRDSMETKVVKIDDTEPDLVKISEAAGLIDAGRLVALPTETVYGIACRVSTDSLSKLNRLKLRAADKHYTLHISDKSQVKKYVPAALLRAEKLINNCWPGPLTIVFDLNEDDIARQQKRLEKEVFENLYQDNSIGIRCPDNVIASALLRLTHNPVVIPSANIAGDPPAVNAQEVLARLAGNIEMVLDSGPCKYKQSSTVVKIGKHELQVLRTGMYSQQQLEAIARVKFLCVCTGNTCRSPMAEGMFRKYLAEKLNCKVDDLEQNGYSVVSAGTMGMAALPASPQSVTACMAKGIDISDHASVVLSEELLAESDLIFVMARSHCERIKAIDKEAGKRCILLARDGDIPDPIGAGQNVYDSCAKQIEKAVKKRISELII